MQNSKVIVVMPAYNAEKTLKKTIDDIPPHIIDEIILTDDSSNDNTVRIAKQLGLTMHQHQKRRGYGGNQKTCYRKALQKHADVIVMLHPDYQYDSSLIGELIRPIIENRYDIMFGSRIRSRQEALKGGMPVIKYLLNRIFCIVENFVLGVNFSEHFSGFRAYKKEVLTTLPFEHFSDDFVFDQQLMISALAYRFRVGEVAVPVRYFSEASSIRWMKGQKFLAETLLTLMLYMLYRKRLYVSRIFLFHSTS